ncbi:hypothetical protein L207DRAFT_436420, partial [Hyaloscypha variabilis F]
MHEFASTTPTATATPAATPSVYPGNFANNAFSDFAPLLTLFGDEFTKQFLATSIGWADDILLGIAPIGIITVIMCAIRIGPSQFLNSLIGRAREDPDDDEKEILSSTSKDVREIWNGNRVVRQTGESKTTEIVYDSAWADTPLSNSKPTEGVRDCEPTVAPHSLEITLYSRPRNPYSPDTYEFWKNEGEKRAPNLTLNIDKTVPEPGKVLLCLGIGLLIQAAVIIVNATVVYYLRWPRAGSAVAAYGYPTWIVGTLCISLGVSMCARVVQHSTDKYTLGPKPKVSKDGLRVIRLQKRIETSDIPAFAIFQNETNYRIRMSLRVANLDLASTRTAIGALLTLTGFICQNIGTRELHWSAGILQLGATLLLAVIRALLRGNVGENPKPSPV